MAHTFSQLEAEYCPPLDSALFAAIVSDYDLRNESSRRDARTTLDQLKETALLEEAAAEFDPSGTAVDDHGVSQHGQDESESDAGRSQSRETDDTSLSNGLSSLDLGAVAGDTDQSLKPAPGLESLDADTKIALLHDIVGDWLSDDTIQSTLNDCNNNWHAAMEELLNHVYLADTSNRENEQPVAAKSIDAFFREGPPKRGRKTKSKGKNKRFQPPHPGSFPSTASSQDPPPGRNIWANSSDDIEYLASRTRLPPATVSSTYHANGASTPKTLHALLKMTMEESKHTVSDEAGVRSAAAELSRDFPSVAPDYVSAIIRLTYPSTSTAHELAQTLTSKPHAAAATGIQVIPNYTPIRTLIGPSSEDPDPPLSRPLAAAHLSTTDPSLRATQYAAFQAAAFEQARAAHRRARSDRYMGGAAAYYSDLARQHGAAQSSATALASDQLAAAQATPTQLDLHGIDVLNAKRIACQRVAAWWSDTAERRHRGTYTVIVGLGKHSEGGRSKLGPAVSKALRDAGWKIEVGGAVIVVTGRTGS